MNPIPPSARRIIEAIRKEVPRPKELPQSSDRDDSCLRWGEACILGLLPGAEHPTPWFEGHLPGRKFLRSEISDLITWWDSLGESDAKRACDAIWPKKRRARK